MNWITQNRRSLPILAILTAAALILAAGEDEWRTLLRYDRDAIDNQSQWWRLITGHLVHSGWSHTAMNIAGLWVVWLLFKDRLGGGGGLLIALTSLVVMNLGFWFRDTNLGWYVGMSGLLHGLYAAGSWDETWRGIRGGFWLFSGIVAKLIYEQAFGSIPLTAESSGGPVWVNSHLYGAIGGFICATILNIRTPFTPSLMRTANEDST